jgi:hypothetical protein
MERTFTESPCQRKYSDIFRKLVDTEKETGDFEGFIAYSIYKKQKASFIEDFQSKKERLPHEEEIDNFCISCGTPQALSDYRQQAQSLMLNLSNKILDKKIAQIERVHVEANKTRKFSWMGVWEGVIGTFIYTLIALMIYFTFKGDFNILNLGKERIDGTSSQFPPNSFNNIKLEEFYFNLKLIDGIANDSNS